jgi:peptidoglycan/LPS O-acetylase OafA/YrhL
MSFGPFTPYWTIALIVLAGGLAYALLVIYQVERKHYDHGLGGILAIPAGAWAMFWYGVHAGKDAGFEVFGYLCMAAIPSIVASIANYMRRRAESERLLEAQGNHKIRDMEKEKGNV